MRLLDSGNKKEPKVNGSRNRPDGDQENLAGMAQRNFPVTSPSNTSIPFPHTFKTY